MIDVGHLVSDPGHIVHKVQSPEPSSAVSGPMTDLPTDVTDRITALLPHADHESFASTCRSLREQGTNLKLLSQRGTVRRLADELQTICALDPSKAVESYLTKQKPQIDALESSDQQTVYRKLIKSRIDGLLRQGSNEHGPADLRHPDLNQAFAHERYLARLRGLHEDPEKLLMFTREAQKWDDQFDPNYIYLNRGLMGFINGRMNAHPVHGTADAVVPLNSFELH